MDKYLNFEDNIFLLNTRIRMIQDMLALDVEAEIFLGKTLEDLEFIDGTLETIGKNLEDNPRLIGREGQFENLSETEWQFSRLLSAFLSGSEGLAAGLPSPAREKLSLLRGRSGERRAQAGQSAGDGGETSSEPVVSGAELSELLKDLE